MERINSGNHEEEYLGLKYLFNQSSAEKGKGKLNKDKLKKSQKGEKQNNEILQERFEKIKELLKKAKSNDSEKLKKEANFKLDILKEEANKGGEGDIGQLSGGQDDILAQINGLSEKQV